MGKDDAKKPEKSGDPRLEYIKKRVLTAFSHVPEKKFDKVYNSEDNLYVAFVYNLYRARSLIA
jgi:hypothetical protein